MQFTFSVYGPIRVGDRVTLICEKSEIQRRRDLHRCGLRWKIKGGRICLRKLSAKFGKAPSAADYEGKKWNRRSERFWKSLEKHLEKGKQLSGKNRKKRVLLIAAGVAVLAGGGLFWNSHSAKAKWPGTAKTGEQKDSHSHRGTLTSELTSSNHFPKRYPIPLLLWWREPC